MLIKGVIAGSGTGVKICYLKRHCNRHKFMDDLEK